MAMAWAGEWRARCVLAVLAALLCVGAAAQTSDIPYGGALAGKLTDLHSRPLSRVAVIARNETTGTETRGITQRNGSFRFTGLTPGEYAVEAESAQMGRGRLEGVVVSAGHEVRVQAAMQLEMDVAPPRPAGGQLAALSPQAPSGTVVPGGIVETAEKSAAASIVAEPSDLAALTPRAKDAPAILPEDIVVDSPALVASLPNEPILDLNVSGIGTSVTTNSIVRSSGLAGGVLVRAVMNAAVAAAAQADLKPIPIAAQRIVTAAGELDPAAAATATRLSGTEIQALPAAGRRWQDFLPDTPTAASAAGGAQATELRGAAQQSAASSIDGANTRMAFGGQGSAGPESSGPGSSGVGGREQNEMGEAWAGGRGSPVAEAAIHEVQTEAGNVESEGMRAAGGRVSIDTARGAQGLHGQGFAFDKLNAWGAQNPFTQWVKETASATATTLPVFTPEPYTPPDRETVWGLGVGSQIKRDKLFWFAALDSYNRNDPGVATVKHPYLCADSPCTQETGFFAQPSDDQMQVLCARLALKAPGSSAVCPNPIVQGLNAYTGILTALDGLLGPAPRRAQQWVGFGRLDWEVAERHRLTLEGIGAHWNSPGGGLTRESETYGTNSFGSSKASEQLVMGRWEAFITPNLLSVAQGSLGRTILTAHAGTPSAFEQPFLNGNQWGQLPQITVDSRYGFTIGNPSRFGAGSYPDERVSQAQEGVDWVRGNLMVKSGFELSHNADWTSLLRNQTGTYYYSTVENFASDALAYGLYGIAGQLQADNQHNCDQTGTVWRDSGGGLRGLGYLPCYSYYSQVMGPTNWNLSTNDWAGFTTAQWHPAKLVVVSGGLRWEREQLPPPLAALNNTDLPLTEKLPRLGNDWGPRISMALGSKENRWPVLRVGYGMYFGRTENATAETALTQTGSPNGDLNFFLRPTDNLNGGGAPPFPYVLRGAPGSVVKPGAVEFAPNFRNAEVHQAVVALEESLPGHVEVTASGLVSLGRRLPISTDTNFDPAVNPGTITYAVVDGTGAGPIKTPRITVPFYASWPGANSPTGTAGRLDQGYQQISEIMNRANSTYEAAVLKISRYGHRGLSFHAHYTYAHAMDWNPNESTTVAGSDVLDPNDFGEEYGTSDLDVRHAAAAFVIFDAPWKMHGIGGYVANGWTVSGIGQFHSGLPYTMRTSGSLAEEFDQATGTAIVALGPGMNGSGGDNRVIGVGRNTYRYPATWKADVRMGKRFNLGKTRELELLAESFNLFNHQNVTELETTGYSIESGTPNQLPTLNFLTGVKVNSTAFGQPLNVNATNFYRERQFQLGVRMRF